MKPASRLIVKALPRGDQFAGQFALPGLIPDLVRGREGKIRLFGSEPEAEAAARQAVLAVYESRTVDTRKAGGYRRLTGAELAGLLDKIDITPTYFAELYGVPQSRVMKWIDGEQDIPHSAHILAKLMAQSDEVFGIIESITEEYRDE